jgi:hypothetical protein
MNSFSKIISRLMTSAYFHKRICILFVLDKMNSNVDVEEQDMQKNINNG